jgi:hypothetical protein
MAASLISANLDSGLILSGGAFASRGLDGLQQGQQVLRMYADHTAARAVEIGYQQKRNRNDNGQNNGNHSALSLLAVADCISAWVPTMIGNGVPSPEFNEINGLEGSP